MSCECHQIGGPWIAEDPSCEIHGAGGLQEQLEEALNRIANLEAQVVELEADVREYAEAQPPI